MENEPSPSMKPFRLVYRTSLAEIAVPPDAAAASIRWEMLEASELHEPAADSAGTGENLGTYTIALEASVETEEEVEVASSEAFTLAEDLDRCWTYVTGEPLHPVVRSFKTMSAPEHWASNSAAAIAAVARSQPFNIKLSVRHRNRRYYPWYPLKGALEVVRAYRAAPQHVKVLMDFHFEALRNPGRDAGLIFLAKGLELVRAMLPGKTDDARQAALPVEVVAELQHSLHWLLGVANQRLDIRHVVRDPTQVSLHDALSSTERTGFLHDSDVILRAVVCETFGLNHVIVRNERT